MTDKKKIILGISCGDINGVGLEVLIKAFSNNTLFDFCTPILYAPISAVNYYKKLYKWQDCNYHVIRNPKNASPKQLNIININESDIAVKPGENTLLAGKIAITSIDLAISDLKKNSIDVIVTLPVNKQNISLIDKNFIGHTEHFSKAYSDTPNLMLLCNENLKIATATNHIPISKVSDSISSSLLEEKIIILIKTLKIDFLISKPKIAVLSLNPHGGDNGLIGDEDRKIIAPVVDNFFNGGNLIYGPYSADGFFGSGNYKNFDAILAMYHDQALIPFKSMSFGNGVNYTAGLPIIRVSPDHGVGYDIAGKEAAKINSLLSAIFLSLEIYKNRLLYLTNIRKTANK